MPLALDDELKTGPSTATSSAAAASQTGFDLQSCSTLFWKPVPILLRHADREEQQEELTFRILTGVSRNNHNMRVLRIHISSESDLFFMHSLEVSEEDFQSLKNEQGILVDFSSFPVKIITLLDRCTSPQSPGAPRFQAVLTMRGGESLFRIVETNDFKQLPHITLAFRPGNDAAVKQFLAFRLLEVKSDAEQLTTQLKKSQGDHSAAVSELHSVRQQLAQVKEQYDKHLLEVQAEAKTQRAAALEERAQEKAEMMSTHEREVSELQRRHQELLSQAQSRIAELDKENRQLRDVKYELDAKVSELSHRLGSAEGTNRSLEEECSRLKATNNILSASKAERDVALNELKAKLGALEEKAQAQLDMLEAQKARIKDLESGSRQLDGRCGELKEALAGAEARAREAQAEVLKGNQIIEKLTADLRSVKEKAKRKQAILVRQEEEVQARDTALAAAAREQQASVTTIDNLKAEVTSLKNENGELRKKLEDSKQQLQSNEQMIRWLNQQVTEAQLGPTNGNLLPSSRYAPPSTYRPALASVTNAMLPPPQSGIQASHPTAATPASGLLTKYGGLSSGLPTTAGPKSSHPALQSPVRPGTTPGHSTSTSLYSQPAAVSAYGATGTRYGAAAQQDFATPVPAHSYSSIPASQTNVGSGLFASNQGTNGQATSSAVSRFFAK